MSFRSFSISLFTPYLAGISLATSLLMWMSADPTYMLIMLFSVSVFVGAGAASSKRPYLIKDGKVDNLRHAICLVLLPTVLIVAHLLTSTGEVKKPITEFNGQWLGKSLDAVVPHPTVSRGGYFVLPQDAGQVARLYVDNKAKITRVDTVYVVDKLSNKDSVSVLMRQKIKSLYGGDNWIQDVNSWFDGERILSFIDVPDDIPHVIISVRQRAAH